MSTHRSLGFLMLYFSALGIALSGYLSYQTLFVGTGCTQALLTCGGNPIRFVGIPQCVLGFTMFLIVAVVSIIILESVRPRQLVITQIFLSLAGTLFAGSLSVYELWIRQPAPSTMPSCVYGFFLFLGVLIAAVLTHRGLRSESQLGKIG